MCDQNIFKTNEAYMLCYFDLWMGETTRHTSCEL